MDAQGVQVTAAAGTGTLAGPADTRIAVAKKRVAGRAHLTLTPPPTAMAWMKVGVPHERMAVPEVYLAPGDALVEIEFATVCGSDLHTVTGRRSAPVPVVLGHEQVGRVVALGEGAVRADGSPLRVGERVVWSVMVSCGSCDRCLGGFPQKCRTLAKYGHEQVRHGWELCGGFATHVQLRAGTATVVVGEAMPKEIAAPLSCASATAMAAVDTAASSVRLDGASLLVTGAGLVGLTALFVGGIGVALSVQAFIAEKLRSIAILKTLGAETPTIMRAYVAQALGLGAVGSFLGVGVGMALQQVLPQAMATLLATDLLQQVEFSSALSSAALGPLAKGLGLGVLTTLLFSLWPLLSIREIKPAAIFRREVEHGSDPSRRRDGPWWRRLRDRGAIDPLRAATVGGIGLGLAVLSVWQAGSLTIGSLFLGGLVVAVTALVLAAKGLLLTMRALPRPRLLSVRQAFGNIQRPGGHTLGVMVAIGVGVMIILAIGILEQALVRQVGDNRPDDSPTFFFIDIQPDQVAGVASLIHRRTGDLPPQLTPLVRSRLHAINGRPVKTEEADQEEPANQSREEKRKNWYLSREYVLTFGGDLPKGNTITKGAWWKSGQPFMHPQVSLEEDAATNLGIEVGQTVELNVQGTVIRAEVSSIRKVEWGNFSTNFYMILSPGSLDGAPMTYVATVRVPPQEEVALQSAVVAAFPNVTAINIGDVLETFARVLDRLSLAIRAVALFCVLTGALVMAAALAATRYRRLYDAVILKALGATRAVIAGSFAAEYALLGCVAGTIGVVLASAFSWVILRYVLELPWTLAPTLLAGGFLCTVLLALLVGFLSTFRILGYPPLAVLRQE